VAAHLFWRFEGKKTKMQRLADVELQLVRYCDWLGALAGYFMRPTRRLRGDTLAFPWSRPRPRPRPRPISLPQRMLGRVRRLLFARSPPSPTPLLRHTEVTLRWTSQLADDIYELHKLDYCKPIHLSLVLGSSSMQQLRVLCLCDKTTQVPFNPTIAKAIVRLPHLHTLRLMVSPDI